MRIKNAPRIAWVLSLVGLLAMATACGENKETGSTQQPVIGQPTQSECLNEMDGEDLLSESVDLLVDGDVLRIVDHHAEFNCCLQAWMEVEIQDRLISVVEVEDPDDSAACDCMCPYELAIEISNLAGEYQVAIYRHVAQPQALIHEQTICLGDDCATPAECLAAVDCLDQVWEIDCLGHWACEAGVCEEFCDFEACGDGICDGAGGENLESCPNDCAVQPECELAMDCLGQVWEIDCLGHWACEAGACEEVCDFESCGDGNCDGAGGESLQSCPEDCGQTECAQADDCLELDWPIYCMGRWTCEAGACTAVCDMETCGDGICDAAGGENEQSCSLDCDLDPTLESFASACGDCGGQECYEPDAPHGESRFSYELELDEGGLYKLRAVHEILCIDVGLLGAELTVEGNTLVLIEDLDHDNPVDCYCSHTANILIAGLAPGNWTLQIYDDDRDTLLVDETIVVGL